MGESYRNNDCGVGARRKEAGPERKQVIEGEKGRLTVRRIRKTFTVCRLRGDRTQLRAVKITYAE